MTQEDKVLNLLSLLKPHLDDLYVAKAPPKKRGAALIEWVPELDYLIYYTKRLNDFRKTRVIGKGRIQTMPIGKKACFLGYEVSRFDTNNNPNGTSYILPSATIRAQIDHIYMVRSTDDYRILPAKSLYLGGVLDTSAQEESSKAWDEAKRYVDAKNLDLWNTLSAPEAAAGKTSQQIMAEYERVMLKSPPIADNPTHTRPCSTYQIDHTKTLTLEVIRNTRTLWERQHSGTGGARIMSCDTMMSILDRLEDGEWNRTPANIEWEVEGAGPFDKFSWLEPKKIAPAT